MRRLRNSTYFLAAVLGFGAQDAMACSCAGPSFAKTYELVPNAFTAVITERRQEQLERKTVARSRFRITETFKGTPPFDVIVTNPGGPCGIYLEVGVEYLFFAPDSGEIGPCSTFRSVEQAEPEIAALRSFVSGERPEIAELWRFSSGDDGCSLETNFGEDDLRGGVTFDGQRTRGPETPAFDSAELKVRLSGQSRGQLTVTVDGTAYQTRATNLRPLAYVVNGEDAVEILRKSLRSDALHLRLKKEAVGPDLDIDVSTVNLTQAGTGAKMLECMSSAAVSTTASPSLDSIASDPTRLGLSTESPYVPGLDQLVVGDRLDDVLKLFPDAVFESMEAGWSVRLDHPLFIGVLYSSRRWPTTVEDDGDTIRRVVYFLKPDADVDEAAAQLQYEAIEKWPTDHREPIVGRYRLIWRDFDGQIVTLDRLRLLICMEFDWQPPR